MLEDDDDDSFGDFTFASFPATTNQTQIKDVLNSNPTNNSHHINGIKEGLEQQEEEDDEWGDFVEHPLGRDGGGSTKQSNNKSKPFDPLGFSSSNDSSKTSQWLKPKGALPLSLFGDIEEEEEVKESEDKSGLNGDLQSSNGIAANTNSSKNVVNVSHANLVVSGVNDIIANLYNQNQQIKAQNVSVPKISNEFSFGSDLSILVGGDSTEKIVLNSDLSNLNQEDLFTNGSSLGSQRESGWNSTSVAEEKSERELGSTSSLSVSNFDGWDTVFSGFNYNSSALSSSSSTGTLLNSNDQSPKGKAENSDETVSRSAGFPSISTGTDFGGWNVDFSGHGGISNQQSSTSGIASDIANLNDENQPEKSEKNAISSRSDGSFSTSDANFDWWNVDFSVFSSTLNQKSSNSDLAMSTTHMNNQSRQNNAENNNVTTTTSNALSSVSPANTDVGGSSLSSNQLYISSGVGAVTANLPEQSNTSSSISNFNSDGLSSNLKDKNLDFSEWNMDFGVFKSSSYGLGSDIKSGLVRNSDAAVNTSEELNVGGGTNDQEDEDDDDGWEFKDAYTESKVGERKDMAEPRLPEISTPNASSGLSNGPNASIDLFTSQPVDLFNVANGSSRKVNDLDAAFDASHTTARNGFVPDAHFRTVEVGTVGTEPEESFGEFTAAFEESRPEQEGKESKITIQRGALPLSIFGDEELETGDSLNVQDAFVPQNHSYPSKSQPSSTVVSITDLISNLYSQAEQNISVESIEKQSESVLDSSGSAISRNPTEVIDDFDDDSWEFTDAFGQSRSTNESSAHSDGDHPSTPSNFKLDTYLDFYSNLGDELCILVKHHLEIHKKDHDSNALSDMEALDVEIQEIYQELEQIIATLRGAHSEDHPVDYNILMEYIEVLREPKFKVLESEYHLSRKLLMVQNDLRSALELMKHTIAGLKILSVGTTDEQLTYVSTWSKIISVCAEELQHGAWIWKQALEKNIQDWILSEHQGKSFVLAMGEIYRVVVVLGASVKVYKLWTLSSHDGSESISALLNECHLTWSTSGLEEALSVISNATPSAEGDLASLADSINKIRGVDWLSLENRVFSQEQTICHLSVLPSGMVPGLEMVVWNEEQYFLKLANLWANLISSDPPKLPHLHLGDKRS